MNRTFNYIILIINLLLIVISLYKINVDETKHPYVLDKEQLSIKSFIIDSIIIISFFVGCYFSALIVENEVVKIDKYCGIFYLLIIGVILLITNFTVLKKEKIKKYISGKKFSKIGVIMFIGIGAIVFGFIDNFGMRLGTEALDDVFVQTFLGPLSKHKKFYKYKNNIQDNFKKINLWTEHDWRKVMNHVLRFKDEISKNNKLKDLSKVLNDYHCEPLDIPKEVLKSKDTTNEYVDNLRKKYDIIYGSKAMLGNTFSNFCAGLLGAGVLGLFTYLTAFDNVDIGDDKLQKKYSDIVEKFSPVLEAIFIAIGCLVPVVLNIAMKSSNTDNNSTYAWLIIFIILLIIIFMMYFSYKNIQPMTKENKINGIKNTLHSLKLRYKIDELHDNDLNVTLNNFVKKL